MAGGMRSAEAGNLAAHAHMAESVLHRPLQCRRQLRHGEFGRVDQVFGSRHGDSANKTGPSKLGIFARQRQSVSCFSQYSVLQSSLYREIWRKIMATWLV